MPSRKKTSLRKKILKNLKKVSFSKQHGKKQKLFSQQKMSSDNIKNFKIKADYIKEVKEPWFSLIALGIKTIEGRLNKGSFKDMKVGETVSWFNEQQGFKREVLTRISRITKYQGFEDYLQTETIPKCLPGILNIDQGLQVYRQIYTDRDLENELGVLAFELQIIYSL